MMTPLDKRLGRSWYQGQHWLQRKYAIAVRVWKQQQMAKRYAAARRAAKEATK